MGDFVDASTASFMQSNSGLEFNAECVGMPIPMKPPLCSEMIAPPDSGMISPP